ncbi:MAG: Gfo/Idh/MocA family oxidoreductase [Planctomycetota bacterium]
MPVSRRNFLAASGATMAAASAYLQSKVVAEEAEPKSAAETPVVGFIGTGIRYHTALGSGAIGFAHCAKIADVDAAQAGRAWQKAMDIHREKSRPIDMTCHEDYQAVLDDKSIDLVVVASPDHWHTKHVIDALNAGKDVYCEKPLTLTIDEGNLIEQAIEKTGGIVQVGTQQRTEYDSRFVQAAAMLRDGRVGDLKKVTVCIGGSREAVPLPIVDPPTSLNWEKWLGQCPVVDYRSLDKVSDTTGWGAGHPFSRAHRYYRWFYEYSGGKLTDWGAHHVDIAMLAMDKLGDDIGPIEIDPISVTHPVKFVDGMPQDDDRFNAATKFNVVCRFADGVEMHVRDTAQDDLGFENGIMFQGTNGRYLVNRGKLVGKPVELLKDNPLPGDPFEIVYGRPKPKSHMAHFFDCVKTRKQPISDVKSHNAMLNVCHAVNIAMRLGRKVTYDPKTRQFVDDAMANTFVKREQRQGYEITV